MRLVVISSAPLVQLDDRYFLYAPYEKEMQVWANHADQIYFCCPIWKNDRKLLLAAVSFPIDKVIPVEDFDVTTLSRLLKAIPVVFKAILVIFKAMQQADHIHLRCPGNMGLLGAFVQMAFPKKSKTAKYAGNWDPKSVQPWSYRLQKWLLSNPFLTRNMQVLVYGEWEGSSTNIKPFFTATYSENEAKDVADRDLKSIARLQHSSTTELCALAALVQFVFVGTLSEGKRPLYAIQLVEALSKKGTAVCLTLYGDGLLRSDLERYVTEHDLVNVVHFKGNQSKEILMVAYQEAHFLLLPSKSEGWPKAVAEAMFWGCVPITTSVSCVPQMLDGGRRGLFLEMDLQKDQEHISKVVSNAPFFCEMSSNGSQWSRKYTLERFETDIKELIAPRL